MQQRRDLGTRRRVQLHPVLLLVSVFPLGWLSLEVVAPTTHTPAAWPVAGIAAGLYLLTAARNRPAVLGLVGLLILAAHLVHGCPPVVAVGFTASCLAETWVLRQALLRGRREATLLDDGDVSKLIGSVALGAAVAAAGSSLTVWATGHGDPLLAAVSVWGTHAAATMIILPLFLPSPSFLPLARRRERLVQAVLTVGTTTAIFASSAVPLLVFVVMPMFAWLAFRGTLREATGLLTLVAVLATVMTAIGLGPAYGLGARYGLPPELVTGILQLFLIDCGLIMLPLAVTVTQQRLTAARDAAGRETMERLISSATGTAIIATDPAGRVTVFNPGAETILGMNAAEVIGHTPELYLTDSEVTRQAAELGCAPSYLEVCAAVVASDEPRRLWHFTRPDGERRSVLATITRIPADDGGQGGYLCTADDVTEREAAQEALLLAVQRLQDLDEVKSTFVSTVSHELRTPITSIIGYTELLEDGAGGVLSDGQADLVERVDRNSRRLLLLIEDLLMLSRIEASDLTVERVPTDATIVVRRACDAVTTAFSTRELDVSLAIPDQQVMVHGDPVQLERMVHNLLSNAVKFTPDGGRVSVALRPEGARVRIEIADTGLGIPAEEQPRLFSRFFRSSTATEQAIQGTGLGLSIVHAIVALHDGTIDVVSADREGSTFTVTLPAHAAA